jgi:predicted RNase H-like nuclease (RuvC/YqgF family)
MKKRIEEKEKLESVVQKLSKKINELSDIAEEKEREIERFSKMEDVMTKTYQSFAISRD